MAAFTGTESIMDRLNSWGMDDVKVKNLGGFQYVIEIKDKDLFRMLEDLKWSYLKIMVSGLPLHCWNSETFKRIANLWGNLEGLGENANQFLDCENVSLLNATNHQEFINEVVVVEVGSELFYVRVSELSPWINDSRMQKKSGLLVGDIDLPAELNNNVENIWEGELNGFGVPGDDNLDDGDKVAGLESVNEEE
ncbi:hypothetical protein V6N13_133401 [Hibiscus sabdariffa]